MYGVLSGEYRATRTWANTRVCAIMQCIPSSRNRASLLNAHNETRTKIWYYYHYNFSEELRKDRSFIQINQKIHHRLPLSWPRPKFGPTVFSIFQNLRYCAHESIRFCKHLGLWRLCRSMVGSLEGSLIFNARLGEWFCCKTLVEAWCTGVDHFLPVLEGGLCC